MFTQSPYGFVKGSARGHHIVSRTPQADTINKVKEENAELKDRLAQLEAAVDALTSKKGKK